MMICPFLNWVTSRIVWDFFWLGGRVIHHTAVATKNNDLKEFISNSFVTLFGELLNCICQAKAAALTKQCFQRKTGKFLTREDFLRFLMNILSILLKL